MTADFSGQRVVVTGITGGIAKATIQYLAACGAEVVVSARSAEKLEHAMANITGKVSGHVMDVTDSKNIEQFFNRVGAFDHLVTPAATSMFAPIREMDFEAARALLESKQWGQMLCVHYAVPYISEHGSITLFSGTVTQKPLAGATMFAAVGAATEAAGRIWALELAPIRVNTVVPGVIATSIWEELTGGPEAAREQLDAIAASLPVQRIGTADDIAKAVVFLMDNGFVNGLSLVVDGGHRLI
ncbi:3-oxoacyl-[acyl-carrier protein] reductase [hydrothermal vent metagenome]|uniref:3-oxoacyl-[acyl-carrier protein] reductase n=1 Tax=hydrothermal vent metagenome TaxID=652676 RepID=A0A3B0RYQ1_9ZZZZ